MPAQTPPRYTFSKPVSTYSTRNPENNTDSILSYRQLRLIQKNQTPPCPTLLQLLRNHNAASDLIAHKAASLPWIGHPEGEVNLGETGYSQPFTNTTRFAQADALGQATAAFEVHGKILEKYLANHGEHGKLGYPLTDEMWTPDHKCRYNTFSGGGLFWTVTTGLA
ncbi:hypothetical protein CJF31_00008486 [Rutstroemia sp. NJR-2017a BVV2]|nr:hypothetical protein CJF31_00008486 [Rutstroemia sp. NJR-2017a BVV2]